MMKSFARSAKFLNPAGWRTGRRTMNSNISSLNSWASRTTVNGKQTGSWGDGCWSFYPTKNIATGEGGMLTTRDAALAEKARAIAGHGVASSTWAREKKEKPWLRAATYAGFNFRMSN